MLCRSSARAPSLLRAAAPRLAAATSARGLAGPSSDAPPAPVPEEFLKGRTPERYAELEKLAEEHNGFLFGEVVRAAPAPRPHCHPAKIARGLRRRKNCAQPLRASAPPHAAPGLKEPANLRPALRTTLASPRPPRARSRSPRASAASGRTGSTAG